MIRKYESSVLFCSSFPDGELEYMEIKIYYLHFCNKTKQFDLGLPHSLGLRQ